MRIFHSQMTDYVATGGNCTSNLSSPAKTILNETFHNHRLWCRSMPVTVSNSIACVVDLCLQQHRVCCCFQLPAQILPSRDIATHKAPCKPNLPPLSLPLKLPLELQNGSFTPSCSMRILSLKRERFGAGISRPAGAFLHSI